ncbi:response regulator transcription factor [Clostridium septicum]|uniref:Stage 0 sporulation protein A homolog n=1 Tax=Clostridium septicum TaxID=1504 RepID=A0A9N7JNQ4_CLOSE|nr:response regulator transcription factor [Clostridium septicum]AYE35211.1 DNA-binding response regulator [Clostridium septicum]MDU1313633.1 response regulator transcription factor [Clostridium septicum]UEC20137.1 response regulator transcription factor [Clostridium septicum]USS01807.1 response regulator transcription factor [Clostridium septicum]WLF70381.1 response regulator transcription factor [Clostridium septicum]
MYKVLIVEDDRVISSLLKENLCKWGYEVECISDFSNVIGEFIQFNPQLVVMDINLPFYNGYHWCTEIRKMSKVPIMFASSESDNINYIMAINMGADDFIVKPFDLNIFVAKVQALLRRAYSFQGKMNVLESKGAILNLEEVTLTYKEKKLSLTKNEFKILQILLENKNKAVSREDIMTYLWESESYIDDNTLTVNVTRIRKRLEEIGLKDFIKTKKGIGYIIGE